MKKKELSDFKVAVHKMVALIPKGKVMTYGQIAGLLGHPRFAQLVGWILHWAEQKNVPYQRVVNRFGGLASGYPNGSRERHRKDLLSEGLKVQEDYTVDLEKYLYKPEIKFERR